ncbi:MAG: hypothetical protein H0T48_10155 [Gemmatimonadaceae bacterium]|nr:hypothetical protein [Gemmatimonadaceae bacterium]
MIGIFIVLRAMLQFSPDSDFDVAGYNIHHLFTGLLLIVAGGIPLALFPGRSLRTDAASVAFGAGLGMALDEWVYLIATDGSNASYLLPVSLRGGLAMVSLATLYVVVLYMVSRNRR